MKLFTMPQYSAEWWEVRRGIPTASEFGRIITPKKGELATAHDTYINELIAARVALDPSFITDRPMTRDMAAGRDMEPEARKWYEMERESVLQVGFCTTDDGRFGCSPDGLVGDDGALELKCPTLATHIGYLRDGELPSEYRAQVHGHLIVTGRQWCDFVSYAPGLPAFILRVVPDEFTDKLRSVLNEFHDRYMAALNELFPELVLPVEAAHFQQNVVGEPGALFANRSETPVD